MIIFANTALMQAINFVEKALHEKMTVNMYHKSRYFSPLWAILAYLRLILFIFFNQHPYSIQ